MNNFFDSESSKNEDEVASNASLANHSSKDDQLD